MITGDHDMLTNLCKTHKCPEHDNPLNVVWDGKLNKYVLKCGAGHYPDEVTPCRTVSEDYRQTDEIPEPVKSKIENKRMQREMAKPKALAYDKLTLVKQVDLGDGKLLTQDQVHGLVAYAERYGLDAYRGHVVMYHGAPYIGLDGYLYKANCSGHPYQLLSRPLNRSEREDYQVADGSHAWLSTVVLNEGRSTFSGIGIVTREEMTERSKNNPDHFASPVVARHPWQLAQKRSEWQALRRAFPIGEEVTHENT